MERYLETYETALNASPAAFGPAMSAVFQAWRRHEGFSCTSFLPLADDHFGAPSDPAIRRSALVALSFADEESGNGYHNHHHNREVTALTFALLSHHIKHGREPVIGTNMAWLTLIAAAIHDYGHDGIGNRIDGIVRPMRLEKLALDKVKPRLMQAGLSPFDFIRTGMIVLTTDVTAADGPSPCAQLKAIFGYHAGGGKGRLGGVDPAFFPLVQCRELTACAGILSDADLGVSAGLDCAITSLNAQGLDRETKGACPATPQALKGFFDTICRGFPATPSGKALLSDGHARIRQSLAAELAHDPGRHIA